MKKSSIIAAMGALAFLTACGNTAEGVRKDAENAADKTEDAVASTGASVDAAMETADVKTALLADTRLDASDINVDTNKDLKTVTLNGTVPTADMLRLAGEVAADKAVGFRVINNLSVKPK